MDRFGREYVKSEGRYAVFDRKRGHPTSNAFSGDYENPDMRAVAWCTSSDDADMIVNALNQTVTA